MCSGKAASSACSAGKAAWYSPRTCCTWRAQVKLSTSLCMLVHIRALFVILNEHRQLLCNGLHLPGLLEYCMSWRPLQHAYLLFRCVQPCNAAHALAQPHSCKQWQTRSLQAGKSSCQHTCNEVRGKGPPKWSKARVTVIPVNHREHQEYEISVQPQTCQGLTLQQQKFPTQPHVRITHSQHDPGISLSVPQEGLERTTSDWAAVSAVIRLSSGTLIAMSYGAMPTAAPAPLMPPNTAGLMFELMPLCCAHLQGMS